MRIDILPGRISGYNIQLRPDNRTADFDICTDLIYEMLDWLDTYEIPVTEFDNNIMPSFPQPMRYWFHIDSETFEIDMNIHVKELTDEQKMLFFMTFGK